MQAEPFRVVSSLARVLDELGVPCLVGGSLASSLHGVPRATQDADMVASLRIAQVGALLEKLKDEFYVDPASIENAIRRRTSFNLIHLPTMYKVDVFITGSDAFSRTGMARRQEHRVAAEGQVFVLAFNTAEDTLLQKLLWYRMGGNILDRQWQDILGILRIQADTLDSDYLEEWAAELELSDLLDHARKDAFADA